MHCQPSLSDVPYLQGAMIETIAPLVSPQVTNLMLSLTSICQLHYEANKKGASDRKTDRTFHHALLSAVSMDFTRLKINCISSQMPLLLMLSLAPKRTVRNLVVRDIVTTLMLVTDTCGRHLV